MKLFDVFRSALSRNSGASEILEAEAAPIPSPPDPQLQTAIDLTPMGDTVRLFLVGDSHCLPARDLLAADAFTGRNYIVVSKYIPGLSASSLMQGGKLARELIMALESENLVREGQFSFASLSNQELAVTFAAGEPGVPPVLVLTLGDIDLRSGFLPKLAEKYDIVLPYETRTRFARARGSCPTRWLAKSPRKCSPP